MKSKKTNKKKIIKKNTKKKLNKKIKRSKFSKKYNKKTIKYKRLKGGRKQSSAMYNEYLEIARPRMGGSAAEASMGANVTNREILMFDLARVQRALELARTVMEQHVKRANELHSDRTVMEQDLYSAIANGDKEMIRTNALKIKDNLLETQSAKDAAWRALISVRFHEAEAEAMRARVAESAVELVN